MLQFLRICFTLDNFTRKNFEPRALSVDQVLFSAHGDLLLV